MKPKKILIITTILALLVGLCSTPDLASAASVSLKKQTTTITLKAGKSTTLKIKTGKRKAKWSIKSGKKYIHLRSKKKASVKVYAIRKGRGTVQCKLGKKKMYCKIKVTGTADAKNQPSLPPKTSQTPSPTPNITNTPTVTTSPSPTAIPTTEPTSSPKPTVTPCPTHIPTEDRLMAEPCKSYKLPIEDENGLPIWRPFGNTYYYFFGSDLKREDFGEIIFTDTNEVPEGADWSMDVSEKQNKSVMAWYMDIDADGKKEMTIGQKGGVVANPNSSYLFCDMCSIKGLEYFYTTDVTDMSYMFHRFALTQGVSASKTLDLGGRFETGNVTNMTAMFQYCGYFEMEKLYLGNFFDVSNVTDAVGMFREAGAMSELTCYVSDASLKKWIQNGNNYTIAKIGIEVLP